MYNHPMSKGCYCGYFSWRKFGGALLTMMPAKKLGPVVLVICEGAVGQTVGYILFINLCYL